jgi:hypothetical protein
MRGYGPTSISHAIHGVNSVSAMPSKGLPRLAFPTHGFGVDPTTERVVHPLLAKRALPNLHRVQRTRQVSRIALRADPTNVVMEEKCKYR